MKIKVIDKRKAWTYSSVFDVFISSFLKNLQNRLLRIGFLVPKSLISVVTISASLSYFLRICFLFSHTILLLFF